MFSRLSAPTRRRRLLRQSPTLRNPTGSPAGSAGPISLVGAPLWVEDNPATTLGVSPTANNALVLATQNYQHAGTVTDVSGGGVATWTRIFGPTTDASGSVRDMWLGEVTTTGSATITVTWSSTPTVMSELIAFQLASTLGAAAEWQRVGTQSGLLDTANSTTPLFPSLTATATGQCYIGHISFERVGSAGFSTGFSYYPAPGSNLVTINPNVSAGAVQPGTNQTPSGAAWAVGALIQDAAPFTLDSLTGLALWLDASDAATLWTDTAGTTHATTEDAAVARWDDKSGNGRHATQSTSGNRPALKLSAQNGRAVLQFDGAGDMFATGLNPSTHMAEEFTILVVAKSTRGAADDQWTWLCGDNDLFIGKRGDSDRLRFKAWSWHNPVDAGVGGIIGAYHLIGHQESDTVRRVLLDGTAITDTTNTGGALISTEFAIGRGVPTDPTWLGPIAEIAVWNRVLTTGERQQAETYLRDKWATP